MRRLALLLLVLAPVLAVAQDTVKVKADVVLAKREPGNFEPDSLRSMQKAFEKKVNYGSLKQLSSQTVSLATARPLVVPLPNAKKAELSLEGIKADVAQLRVKVPPTDTVYTLGKQGSLYVQAGTHEGGDLWLVLSPAK
jgi:hypothetical protein